MSAISIDRCQPAGTSMRKAAVGLAALDERLQGPENRGMAMTQLGVPVLSGVDGDERVVATEAPPARGDDAGQRLGGIAAVWLRGLDDLRCCARRLHGGAAVRGRWRRRGERLGSQHGVDGGVEDACDAGAASIPASLRRYGA
jgi:hypothetical protein